METEHNDKGSKTSYSIHFINFIANQMFYFLLLIYCLILHNEIKDDKFLKNNSKAQKISKDIIVYNRIYLDCIFLFRY